MLQSEKVQWWFPVSFLFPPLSLQYHSFCLQSATTDPCTCGYLRDIILPPEAVNYPRHVPLQRDGSSSPTDEGATPLNEGPQSLTSPVAAGARDLGSAPSMVEDHAPEEEEPEALAERQCIVMDGHQGSGSRRMCGRTVHSLPVTKETTAPVVLV